MEITHVQGEELFHLIYIVHIVMSLLGIVLNLLLMELSSFICGSGSLAQNAGAGYNLELTNKLQRCACRDVRLGREGVRQES